MLVEDGKLVKARDIVRGVSGLPMSPRESDAGRDARRQAALLASELDARVPKISLAERPRDVDVLLDGRPFAPADSSAWQGVDPGAHTIVVRANEHACASIAITLTEGQVRTIDLRDAALSCRPPGEAAWLRTASSRGEPASSPAPRSERGPVTWPWGGVALAGVGVVAAGIGAYVLVRTKADYDSVGAGCTPSGCDPAAFDVRHRAHEQANIATVAAGVGVAAIGGGILWLVLGRPSQSDAASPRLGIGPASVSFVIPILR